ncbi:hypothetical protein [Micromonospora zamorensis]|uniref:hypothetical protein n=1 Tax=Micromonospora zamorensis TaxID=709883 RepID=UPI0033ACFBB2
MRTALIVGATLATAVVVDLISGMLIRRVARGHYQWLLEPLRQACRRAAAAVLLVGALYYTLPVGPADGASAWDLRCDIREGLVAYLRDHHPQWLPRTRSQYQP